jgi:hypothetical protein
MGGTKPSVVPIAWSFARALGCASFALALIRLGFLIALDVAAIDLREGVATLIWVTIAGLFVGGVIDIALHVRAQRRERKAALSGRQRAESSNRTP